MPARIQPESARSARVRQDHQSPPESARAYPESAKPESAKSAKPSRRNPPVRQVRQAKSASLPSPPASPHKDHRRLAECKAWGWGWKALQPNNSCLNYIRGRSFVACRSEQCGRGKVKGTTSEMQIMLPGFCKIKGGGQSAKREAGMGKLT